MTYILGIETSCDDTCASIISINTKKVLSNIVISQNAQHQAFKGVVPEIAARSHLNNLESAIRSALEEAAIRLSDIDAFAATSGPGLIGGVIVGCVMGKTLASRFNKPFIAINHLEGHALTARLTHNIPYPYLLLLASGGHCQFIAVETLGKYKILGQTLDDAAGEAFDKVAKMLGLPFPGGPEIEKRSMLGDPYKYKLPKPIINRDSCDLSFSGLKTATRLLIEKEGPLTAEIINNISASFEHTICEVLALKTLKAIAVYRKHHESNRLVLAGGVAANQYLRKAIGSAVEKMGFELTVPQVNLCTDNAAMIAYAGLERLQAGITNNLNFCPRARWSLEEI
jgi:N6-L-threonylcarbamoyladenine synthase